MPVTHGAFSNEPSVIPGELCQGLDICAFVVVVSWRAPILVQLGILLFLPTLAQRKKFGFETRSSAPVVDLGYAKYTGAINETSRNTYFLGIRYAAPPIGSLRWRAPQPPAPTAGIQLANTPPFTCYNAAPEGTAPTNPFRDGTFRMGNSEGSLDVPPSSEDCLFLNVVTPGTNQSELLPVLVYIHGGGYQIGYATAFNGDYLVELSGKRIVVVILQYRLGVFGFLPGKAVKNGGNLNTGLLDQHFALKWVREHISKFGGDPEKVTIWGTSAGAGSVLQHVIAQNGNTQPPLFRGAITSSAFLAWQYNYSDPIPEALYSEIVSQTGCSSSSDSLECLRNTDVAKLQNVNTNVSFNAFYGTSIFVPIIDGTFITQRPTLSLRSGKVNGEMLLAFTNSHEGNTFVNQNTTDVANFVAQLFPLFDAKAIDAVVAKYSRLGSPVNQAILIFEDATFLCPTYSLMHAFPNRAFKGEFAIPPGYHATDIVYYFPSVGDALGALAFPNKSFVDAFGEAFTDFAFSLDPNIKVDPMNITPRWDRWHGKFEMLFNKTETDTPLLKEFVSSAAVLERCNLWGSLGVLSGQ
ncbi:hypothetical protein AX15_002716 [Amanita polypyramis BW_CC]|nr:hypothetical protein AX15_002716 [Amanita polypyramis BW_CC]